MEEEIKNYPSLKNYGVIRNFIKDNLEDIKKEIFFNLEDAISLTVKDIIDSYKESLGNYSIIFLLQSGGGQISPFTLDKIYFDLPKDKQKDILLIINSLGGQVEPAYLISKCCKNQAKSKFSVSIPRKAKSAATLICLGANEIHMGDVSELGPIDLQIDGVPARSLIESVKYIASLVNDYPKSSVMFSEFIKEKVDLKDIGHFSDLDESIIDYAKNLLKGRPDAEDIAKRLVKDYKDHGFVIDKEEAKIILGNRVMEGAAEFNLCNDIYKVIDDIRTAMASIVRKTYCIQIIGSCDFVIISENKHS